ncbi:MAG: hypothetical protein EBZ36_12220 [Acidobacteria bacterium]|nr:hypothetical protein [Acidobacteriota bacterium]
MDQSRAIDTIDRSRIPGSGGRDPRPASEASTLNPLTFSDPRDQAFASDGVSRYIDPRRSAG